MKRSSFCSTGACVETGRVPGFTTVVAIHDSKTGKRLAVRKYTYRRFILQLRKGRLVKPV